MKNLSHLFKRKGWKFLPPPKTKEKDPFDIKTPIITDLGNKIISMQDWEDDPFEAATRNAKQWSWGE